MQVDLGKDPVWVSLTKDDPARFKIKPLTGEDRFRISQVLWTYGQKVLIPPREIFAALRAGLVGWEGVVDEDGTPVEFSVEKLDYLADGALLNLFGQIHSVSVLGRAAPVDGDESAPVDPEEAERFLTEDEPGN